MNDNIKTLTTTTYLLSGLIFGALIGIVATESFWGTVIGLLIGLIFGAVFNKITMKN